MRHRLNNLFFGKMALAAAALAGFLVLTGAPQLRADHDDCQRRTVKAEHKLHEAIEHHSYESKQADRSRRELHEAREHCWNTDHRWWDEHEHRWHTDRDWDDHDHDRDHDGVGPGYGFGTGGGYPSAGTGGYGEPSCLYCPSPTFSDEAEKAKYQGTVTLQAVVTADGRATNIRVVKGLGVDFDKKAMDVVRGWRFTSARGPDGKPTSVLTMIEVTFRLR